MLQESPRDQSLRTGLALTYMCLSEVYGNFGENERSDEVLSQAIDLLEGLWTEGKDLEIGRMLGCSYSTCAVHRGWHGDYEACWSDTRRGVEVLREALQLAPKDDHDRLLVDLCAAYRRGNRLDYCLQGVEVGRQVLELQKPSLLLRRREYVKAVANAACMCVEGMGRPSGAEPLLRKALDENHRNMREFAQGTGLEFALNGWLAESLFLQGKSRAAMPQLAEVISGKKGHTPPCIRRRGYSTTSITTPGSLPCWAGWRERAGIFPKVWLTAKQPWQNTRDCWQNTRETVR